MRAKLLLAATILSASTLSISVTANAAPVKYKNCTAMNAKYRHGVGKKGAKDRSSGKPVTTFAVNNALYLANTRLDRDKDGVACEKR